MVKRGTNHRRKKKANNHAKRHAAGRKGNESVPRKAYRMSIFLSILLLTIVGILAGIAIANWQKGGYKNVWIAFGWGVVAFIVFGVGAGLLYYYYIIKPAKTATKATVERRVEESSPRAHNRAWISVDVQLNGPITFDARGAIVRFVLKITNTGDSPALKVNIYPKIINQQNPNIIGEQRETCGVLPDGSNSPGSNKISWGTTLFPGPDHAQAQPYVLTVPAEELRRSEDFDGYFKGKIMLHILGCVDYAIDPSGERHQTLFSYSIMTTTPGKSEFIEMGRDMTLDSIFVSRDSTGWGAN